MSIYPSRYPPKNPDRIQLYTMPTPNGRKIGVALEVMELPYEAHRIDIMAGDQHDDDYVQINPNAKIPTIIDPEGPGGQPLALMESGAILLYLAEKSGRYLHRDPRLRWETIQWLMFQVGGVGPMFGQFGHFYKFARGKTTDTYAEERYAKEAERLLGVIDRRLDGRDYLVGEELSVADIATVPWIDALDFYQGKERVNFEAYPRIQAWVERCRNIPGFEVGYRVGSA
ncbi:MAG: glutathione binding-like protein [Myxococcota bacterium]